jgi:hypothetical protein
MSISYWLEEAAASRLKKYANAANLKMISGMKGLRQFSEAVPG